MNGLVTTLRGAYRLVVGGGEPGLVRRKEYHLRRQVAEQTVLQEAKTKQGMFTTVTCPACGQTETSDQFVSPVGFSFSVCAADGTVYMNPAPTIETLNRLYNDESYATYWSVGHSAEPVDFERVDAAVPKPGNLGERQKLLDVGCATGEFLKLARKRFECYGVEIVTDTAELARRDGFDVVTGTVADVPGRERFDVITMLQVIEHLVEPTEPLAEIHRLLKPGGIFYLNTPCTDSSSFRLFRERHMHVSSFGHVSLFTKAGLDRLASRCGFAMIDHGYCGGMDIALHDLVGYALAPSRFKHRVAFYSPRLMNASRFVDGVTFGKLTQALCPRGNESYQWAVWRKQ
jgi:SAM-dependent methyltransferase